MSACHTGVGAAGGGRAGGVSPGGTLGYEGPTPWREGAAALAGLTGAQHRPQGRAALAARVRVEPEGPGRGRRRGGGGPERAPAGNAAARTHPGGRCREERAMKTNWTTTSCSAVSRKPRRGRQAGRPGSSEGERGAGSSLAAGRAWLLATDGTRGGRRQAARGRLCPTEHAQGARETRLGAPTSQRETSVRSTELSGGRARAHGNTQIHTHLPTYPL